MWEGFGSVCYGYHSQSFVKYADKIYFTLKTVVFVLVQISSVLNCGNLKWECHRSHGFNTCLVNKWTVAYDLLVTKNTRIL